MCATIPFVFSLLRLSFVIRVFAIAMVCDCVFVCVFDRNICSWFRVQIEEPTSHCFALLLTDRPCGCVFVCARAGVFWDVRAACPLSSCCFCGSWVSRGGNLAKSRRQERGRALASRTGKSTRRAPSARKTKCFCYCRITMAQFQRLKFGRNVILVRS
jgi:hypothetical protein